MLNKTTTRLEEWRNIYILVKELRHIQKRFTSSRKTRSVEDRARIFSNLVMEGKITAALKFLDTDSSSGILTLTPDIIADLEQKHPDEEAIADNTFGPLDHIPIYVFDCINEENIMKAAMNTKGSAGPSGMDAELYRRMLVSRNFSAAGKEMREEIALLTKNLHPKLLEPLVASRLIPLDKNIL